MSRNKILLYSSILIFELFLWISFPKTEDLFLPHLDLNIKRPEGVVIAKPERDPFRYHIERKHRLRNTWKPSSIVIKGIMWDEENPSAMISINGEKTKFVSEGDRIGGIRILKIKRDRIIIDERGKREIILK